MKYESINAANEEKREQIRLKLMSDIGPLLAACFYLLDCGASEELAKRYNFCVYPMFFMYMDSRLVYASKTLNGFGVEPEDCVAQVEKCIVDGQRGRFLPENFKFADKHEASFASVFDLH